MPPSLIYFYLPAKQGVTRLSFSNKLFYHTKRSDVELMPFDC